jgi:hypothetical protein
MMSECSCRRSVSYSVEAARAEAREVQGEYARRLESFREGIAQGAREMAARHLYLSGVYAASLDNGLARNPDVFMVRESLGRRLESRGEPLLGFYRVNLTLVESQGEFVDVERALRGVLRDRRGAPGLLEARVRSELEQAEASLSRLERLEEFLASWRESVRLESQVGLDVLVDMHRR